MTQPTPPEWVEDAIVLEQGGRIHTAMDIIFENFDTLHQAGKFAESDAALASIDVDRLGSFLIVAILGITRLAAKHLPSRPAFVARARAKLHAERPDDVDRLLSGLEE